MSKTKTYIDVAYKDRELAKRLGARWDASVKRWYCPSGSTLALIYKWRKAPVTDAAKSPNTANDTASEPARVTRSVTRVSRPVRAMPAAAPLFEGTLELPLAS